MYELEVQTRCCDRRKQCAQHERDVMPDRSQQERRLRPASCAELHTLPSSSVLASRSRVPYGAGRVGQTGQAGSGAGGLEMASR